MFSPEAFRKCSLLFAWVAARLLHTERAWQDSNLRPSLLFVVRGSIRLSYKHVSLYMARIRQQTVFGPLHSIATRCHTQRMPLCNPPRGEKAHELALYSCGLRKGGEQGPSLPLLYASHMAPTRWLHRRVLPLRDG